MYTSASVQKQSCKWGKYILEVCLLGIQKQPYFSHTIGVLNHIEVSLLGGGGSYFSSNWDTFPLKSEQVFLRKGWWKTELERQDLGWSPWISVGSQTPQNVSLHSTASLWRTRGALAVAEMLDLSWDDSCSLKLYLYMSPVPSQNCQYLFFSLNSKPFLFL